MNNNLSTAVFIFIVLSLQLNILQLKLVNLIDWNWFAVFYPIIIPLVLLIASAVFAKLWLKRFRKKHGAVNRNISKSGHTHIE